MNYVVLACSFETKIYKNYIKIDKWNNYKWSILNNSDSTL